MLIIFNLDFQLLCYNISLCRCTYISILEDLATPNLMIKLTFYPEDLYKMILTCKIYSVRNQKTTIYTLLTVEISNVILYLILD
jgi:hypothetical protein